jgi:hypothetical protein
MAAAGSQIDRSLLRMFVLENGQLVRHPTAEGFNDPAETSRDQVVQGLVANVPELRSAALYYAKKGWVNKDYLSPEVRYYLYKLAKIEPPLWVKLLAYPNLVLSMVWNSFIKPREEQNQFICILTQYPPVFMSAFFLTHPSLRTNLKDYWSGWRDQPEIEQAFLTIIENKLK